ncbi:MAG: UMP kinase [Thermoanaerobaculia bacterium]
MPGKKPKYKRILLKVSGEAFSYPSKTGLCTDSINFLSKEIKSIHQLKIQIGIVVGGGNIIRGLTASKEGLDRATGDYMGMLATSINALALMDSLEKLGIETRVMTAIEIRAIAEPFIRRRAIRHLEKGRIVIFAAGTGNPYFTTDSAAALRASEVNAEVILKATKVDGVYDKDPKEFEDAKKFSSVTYQLALEKGLKIMDAAALSLCSENNIPIIVFDFFKEGNLKKVILGEDIGTIVRR